MIFDYILRDIIKNSEDFIKNIYSSSETYWLLLGLRFVALFPSATIISHITFSFPPILRKAHYLPCIINR